MTSGASFGEVHWRALALSSFFVLYGAERCAAAAEEALLLARWDFGPTEPRVASPRPPLCTFEAHSPLLRLWKMCTRAGHEWACCQKQP